MNTAADRPRPGTAAVPPLQFTTKRLFLATFYCAAASAVLVYWGAGGLLVVLAGVFLILLWRWHPALAFAFLGLPVLIALLMPAISTPRWVSRRTQCVNNLKQVELALMNYHDDHGRFPPAYIAGGDGTPMHSWRVLILPYLEENALYKQYNFAEPWDGPNNRKLLSLMPPVFRCPSDESDKSHTNYVAIVGADTAWKGASRVKRSEFLDGMSKTIHVVEVHESGIPWLEPRDVDVDDFRIKVYMDAKEGDFSSGHPGGFNVSLADGSVRFVKQDIPPDALHALLTKDGGESLPTDW